MAKTILDSIYELVDYLYEDEKKHYEEVMALKEYERPKNHIFLHVKAVKDWADSPSCPLTPEE